MPQEIGQIAGRAGRFRKDGAFGVTGDAPDLDPDVVAAVEGHVFPAGRRPPNGATPRSISSRLPGLMRSLAAPAADGPACASPRRRRTRRRCASSSTTRLVVRRAPRPRQSVRLWEACQTPDFRKTTQDEHTRLIGGLFEHLTQGDRRVPEDWMRGPVLRPRPRSTATSTPCRCGSRACARWPISPTAPTGSPIRPPGRRRARDLEDRLSDTLHQSLMQRFVDRRTSTLLRSLRASTPGRSCGGIGADGAVTVEGHVVGRLSGVHFEPERGASALEDRALRGAVERAVAPEVARRLGELASEGDEAFALEPGGVVAWRGLATGEIVGGGAVQAARAADRRLRRRRRARARGAAARGLRRRRGEPAALAPLKRLTEAIADGHAAGLARGVAYQLVEQFGVLDRRRADEHVSALSKHERRVLKALGVRFGAFSLYLPAL